MQGKLPGAYKDGSSKGSWQHWMHSLNWTSTVIRLMTTLLVIREPSSSDYEGRFRDPWSILDWTMGVLLRIGRRDCRRQGVRDITRKPTEAVNLAHKNSQSLNQQPGCLHWTELGRLHIYSCSLIYLQDYWQLEQGLSLMLWLALGNIKSIFK